jgi:vacuolar-type H+-ATPase subunit I/STV1
VVGDKSDIYEQALAGKRVPVLTLDNNWYKLFTDLAELPRIQEKEKQLNELVQRQGQLNVDSKNIKKLKKKLMDEIVPMANELGQKYSKSLEKKLDDHKRLIEECNEKLEEYQDELMDLPRQIEQVNHALMLLTMSYCYESMQENTRQIVEIAQWVKNIRIELKKNLVRKQEMEYQNRQIYSYMHDLFGAEVIDLFDMQYDPMAVGQKKEDGSGNEKK